MFEIPDIGALSNKYQEEMKKIMAVFDTYKDLQQQLLQQLSLNPEHDFYGKLSLFSEQLAKNGWTIPLGLTPGELYDLLDLYETDSYDQAFLALYSDENGYHFKKLAGNLTKSMSYSKWESLIIQCIKAYNAGDYLITIPSLFSILEGVINEYFDPTKVNLNVIKLCKNQTEKEKMIVLKKFSGSQYYHLLNTPFRELLSMKTNQISLIDTGFYMVET